jgi:hypothetical protein
MAIAIDKTLVVSMLRGSFERAAKDFAENATGPNWQRLDTLMWALQHASKNLTSDGLHELLHDKGVGMWDEILCGHAKSKAVEGN